jgi:SAM-dependent methyltransferase
MNEDQIAYWNGDAGDKWTRNQEILDRTLEALGLAAIEAAGPATGERVLDIGCGCGSTTIELARRVGPGGEVVGADISAPMVARARERARQIAAPITVLEADAAAHSFERGRFDLAFSRFGVMFFDDPVAAFANIRRALKSSGRLAFVCWRPVRENGWVTSGLEVVLSHVPRPEPMDPNAPGPFAFADAERVKGILAEAGFRDVGLRAFDADILMGEDGTPESAAAFTVDLGPVGRLLADASAATKARVEADLVERYRTMKGPDGKVRGNGAVWIVTARNSPPRTS